MLCLSTALPQFRTPIPSSVPPPYRVVHRTPKPYLSTILPYPTSVPYCHTLPQYRIPTPCLSTRPANPISEHPYPTSAPYPRTQHQYRTA
eukprot:947245-Rhodomonas_salina.2